MGRKRGWPEDTRPSLYSRIRNSACLEIGLVCGHDDRHVVLRLGSAVGEDLVAHKPDVGEAVFVAAVVDEYVGGGVPQPVAAVVGPLLQRSGGKVADGRTVGQTQVVQSVVDDHRHVMVSLFAALLLRRVHCSASRQQRKERSEETQTLRAGCSKAEPNIFDPQQTHFPGARDGQNLISWRRSLTLPTNPVW